MDTSADIPDLALSVRQPWAWAIVAGHKVIENRSPGAIRAGKMGLGPIAIHAAIGMTRKEYEWGAWRLARHGVVAPRPEMLPRRGIIGRVTVTGIVSESDSPWFGGPMGLVLTEAVACDPIPASGALGYFQWIASGELAPRAPWMGRWDRPADDFDTGDLFPDLEPSYRSPPKKPWSA
ncbi:MAG: hypothetical protein AAF871_14480 [Pseudomonadota bacterium]